jgi:hypothetical protein
MRELQRLCGVGPAGAAQYRAVGRENGVEMANRRLATDIGFALLIAFPATLPAAPNPWSASDEVGKPSVADAQADSAFPYDTAAIPDSEFDG